MKIQIEGTYTEHVQTMHPDIMVEVPFKYKAVVDGDEVNVVSASMAYENQKLDLRTTPRSTSDYLNRFLANIREHARKEAYKIVTNV